MSGSSIRFAPLTGVIAVAAIVASFIVTGEPPDFDSSGEDVISFYAGDEDAQMFGSALAALGALLFVFFGNSVRGALRLKEDEAGGLSAVVFGGSLIAAVGMASFASFNFALADAADEESFEPAAAQALNILNGDFFFPIAVGFATLFIAAGIAIAKRGALPKWLGWLALLIGVLSVTPLGFLAFAGGGVWILIASVILATRTEATAPPPIT